MDQPRTEHLVGATYQDRNDHVYRRWHFRVLLRPADYLMKTTAYPDIGAQPSFPIELAHTIETAPLQFIDDAGLFVD